MAQATLLQLLNVPDEDDIDDVVDQVEFQHSDGRRRHRHRHRHHNRHDRQLDPYWSSEFEIFGSDLSSDFSPSDVLPLTRNLSGQRTQSLFIDSLNDDVSEPESVITSADIFDRENQVNFVMDLLHQRVEQSQLPATHLAIDPDFSDAAQGFDPQFGTVQGNDDIDPTQLDPDLGLGFLDSPEVGNSGFVEENFDSEEHFVTGLRVVDMGSESDSDLSDVEIEFDADDDDDVENACAELSDEGDDDPSLGLCWDSFQIEDHREPNEDLEWEEVDEGVDEREVLSMFLDDDDDDVSVMAREDMIGVMGGLEWEVLLNVHNMEANTEIGTEGFNELNFGDHEHDEYYATEYDMLFGNFAESENPLMGKPPASKDVVKNLPLVVFTEEDLEKNDLICAVCKDDMAVGQNSRQLPCNHRYHGDCILPWLGIRNTCPVCRYELPTDDQAYERRKNSLRAALLH
ncbi:OLC1v1013992C1 [Oldenlandia corymbosa var. corymbosa]|uniref:RING-type E3 ubiquitin transferase n=1 Tax=Oldenlandia corymbosa var. corymbosa TaxID=529605 RepID=A0AAV1E017_OLDCO|nr:OLC1v1013992C1 [Oldenlandia corymbosa var. corymbosa]